MKTIYKVLNVVFENEMLPDLTYNQSVKIMWNLPRSASRIFIEPLTGTRHLKKVLIKRFLSFVDSIKNSKKIALKNLFKIVKSDCGSVTGRNLQRIKHFVEKASAEDLVPADCDSIEYFEMKQEDHWKLDMVREITDSKFGEAFIEGFSRDELKVILHNVCTSWIKKSATFAIKDLVTE